MVTSKSRQLKIKCGCGKVIIGFSERHLLANLDIHKKTSGFHKAVISILKKNGIKVKRQRKKQG